MGDKAEQDVRERVWVEKFDHEGPEPVLVERVFLERVLTVQPDGSVREERVQTVEKPEGTR